MATRALVGFIKSGPELISTYNHYDGYPENLGKGLELHYSTPEEALKIASMGYISYLNPKTGEIEAKHKEPAERTDLGMDFAYAMLEIAKVADSYGADYVYIYDIVNSKWVNVKMYGIRQTSEDLENLLQDLENSLFGPSLDEEKDKMTSELFKIKEKNMAIKEKDYMTEWKKFINEEIPGFEGTQDKLNNFLSLYDKKPSLSKVISPAMAQAMKELYRDQPEDWVDSYKESLDNDISLNGKEQYANFSVEDFKEDYDNYIADKS